MDNVTPAVGTYRTALDELHLRAASVADEVALLPGPDVDEIRFALRERLDRGVDDDGLPSRLRPLLNSILDVVDRSWLTDIERVDLERYFTAHLRCRLQLSQAA